MGNEWRVELVDCDPIRGGVSPILAKVPTAGGVYAWYKKIFPPDPLSSTPEAFAEFILAETELPHMLARRSAIRPMYEVVLRSKRSISEHKRDALASLCRNPKFRQFLHSLLTQNGITFQQPLYIGKAMSLNDRVSEHLTGVNSSLRERLSKASIDIARCILAYIVVPDFGPGTEDEDASLLVEEVLSKLFLPAFTERYG